MCVDFMNSPISTVNKFDYVMSVTQNLSIGSKVFHLSLVRQENAISTYSSALSILFITGFLAYSLGLLLRL